MAQRESITRKELQSSHGNLFIKIDPLEKLKSLI